MLQSLERKKMDGEKFHIQRGSLTFSTDAVNETLTPGTAYEGSFVIYGAGNRAASGFILSTNPAVKLLVNEFSGARESIAFEIAGQGASQAGSARGPEAEKLEGVFRILSDQGEYELPYCFTYEVKRADSSLGPVRNLLHYVNLARTNWQEAVSLFYQKEFYGLVQEETWEDPDGIAHPLEMLYRGLSAREGNEHNVEEFLIAAGKKHPVEFTTDVRELAAEVSAREVRSQAEPFIYKTICIHRKGWGYTCMQVQASGRFLSVPAKTLTEADFQDGAARLTVGVDVRQLHVGRNFGSITLTPAYGDAITLPVTVSFGVQTALRSLHRREHHEIIRQMMEEYLQLRGKKESGKDFAAHMGSLVRRLQESDRNGSLTALYRIHYLLTVHQEQDAVWELQTLGRRLSGDERVPLFSAAQFDLEDDLTYCYRMYLTALCVESPEAKEAMQESGGSAYGFSREVVRALERKQKQNPGSFWIAWLLLYADPGRMMRPMETMRMLRRYYERGNRSPILYMEYYQLLRDASGTLRELGDFELQTLWFASRRGLLTEDVVLQLNYLALRRKTFSRRLFQILCSAYETSLPGVRSIDLLESICSLLIRGNMTDSSCFIWYQRGIEAGLTITSLLDYYMLALPEGYEGALPQMAVRYFAYQNTLPWRQSAYLYRYVTENREELAEFYEQYAQQMDRFTQEELLQHRISPDLAVLYAEFLSEKRVLTGELAAAAVPAAFSCEITAAGAGVMPGHAAAVYENFVTEQYFPLQGGRAYFPIYGERCILFTEEDNGDRHAGERAGVWRHLMDYRRISKLLSVYTVDHIGFDLYRAQEEKFWPVSEDNHMQYRRLIASPEIPEHFKQRLMARLMHYYKAEGAAYLEEYLSKVSPEGLSERTRGELICEMAREGLIGKAYEWLLLGGSELAEGDVLLRVVSGILEEEKPAADPVLAELAFTAFRKKCYNDALLQYLAQVWDGTTKELLQVREAMQGFSMDTTALSRRMLVQMLFTGEYISGREELIAACRMDGTDEELLADALAQSSHQYFVLRREMGKSEFDLIADYGRKGVPLLDICRIAWLSMRAGQSGETSQKDMEVTELFLSDLLERKTVFPFFRQFTGSLPLLQAYADETLVEYRSEPAKEPPRRVLYHYAMEQSGVRGTYAAKEMKEMYEGVYVTGFLLFFGEQMHYYITDDNAEKNIVESGTVGQDARTKTSGQDRFDAINEITMLAALGRDGEALSKLEKYSRKSYLVSRMFEDTENAL